MTRQEFETALDTGKLWIIEYQSKGRKDYLVRRNGRTKTWKMWHDRWEIPIKWKFKDTARIDEHADLNMWFVIHG